jgi:hypothetical protein
MLLEWRFRAGKVEIFEIYTSTKAIQQHWEGSSSLWRPSHNRLTATYEMWVLGVVSSVQQLCLCQNFFRSMSHLEEMTIKSNRLAGTLSPPEATNIGSFCGSECRVGHESK